MKKWLFIALLIVVAFICMSIYSFSEYRIEFQTNKLSDGLLIVPKKIYNDHYIEVVWNTGDTGSSVIINSPGKYICSIKDVWNLQTGIQKGIFIHGYYDTIRIDTIIDDIMPYNINEQYFRQFTFNINGQIKELTYRDTSWFENGKFYYTETHPLRNGFWSGLIDSITIDKVSEPLIINAKSLIIDGKKIQIDQWRALQ
jgi:hypothetical protein